MKITTPLLLILFVFLFSNGSNAQFGGGGLDRSISGQNSFKPSKKNEKPIDYVQVSVDNLTKNLNLDGFQAAIVKTILEDFKDKTITITGEEIPSEAKDEKMKIERDKMEAKIMDVLTKEQKVTYQEIKNKVGKKEKKKKNKKDEVEEPENTTEEK